MENIILDDSIQLSTEDVMHGKFLTFDVFVNRFGIEISYVTEIIGIPNITRVPHTYHYIKGIVNLRGTIVPVMDMRLRFGLEEIPYDDRTCIVVIDSNDVCIGLVVDQVSEVLDISDEAIQPPPKSNNTVNNYIRAIANSNEDVIQLLDVEKIL